MENTELYYTIQIYAMDTMIILLAICGFFMGLAYLCNKFWNWKENKRKGQK